MLLNFYFRSYLTLLSDIVRFNSFQSDLITKIDFTTISYLISSGQLPLQRFSQCLINWRNFDCPRGKTGIVIFNASKTLKKKHEIYI